MAWTSATVRNNAYVDSITLLQANAQLLNAAGVEDAALVMASDLNRQLLTDSGLLVGPAESAGPNDLVIAVRSADAASGEAALLLAEHLLAGRRAGSGQETSTTSVQPRSVRSAHRLDPEASLALISVPGQFAAGEARQALAEGMHVFLFSDNVSLADEIELKRRALQKDLLVMGTDCGTAILNGVGFGFANLVRRGRIGLVGASGTGLQEVTSLLHQAGEGVSHAIGTGGRDLHEEVGGITTLQALALLGADPGTEVIVLLSKPAAPSVAERVLRAAAETGKPVIACLLGATLQPPRGVQMAGNLYQAARMAAPQASWSDSAAARQSLPRGALRAGQDLIRGLFCGGTLCQESVFALRHSGRHVFIDFGDDQYTRGRAHPILDPTLRNQAIVEAGADPSVAVLLLDVILGLGAHADPVGAALPAIRAAVARAAEDGRQLTVLAHAVGTDLDPQGLGGQQAALGSAGVHVFGSMYHAAEAASRLVDGVPA
jgi:FdrA protein